MKRIYFPKIINKNISVSNQKSSSNLAVKNQKMSNIIINTSPSKTKYNNSEINAIKVFNKPKNNKKFINFKNFQFNFYF